MKPLPKKIAVSAVAWMDPREPLSALTSPYTMLQWRQAMSLVKLLDGFCVLESWRKERKWAC